MSNVAVTTITQERPRVWYQRKVSPPVGSARVTGASWVFASVTDQWGSREQLGLPNEEPAVSTGADGALVAISRRRGF